MEDLPKVKVITELTDKWLSKVNLAFSDIKEFSIKDEKFQKKGRAYQLTNIDIFENSEKFKEIFKTIEKMEVTDNNLTKVKLLSYLNLEILLLQNNQISRVDLHLPNLTVLNLSSNNLRSMIELIDLPNLRDLNLSQNSIQEISFDNFKYVKNTLMYLDLSENMINFEDMSFFFNAFDNLGNYMKELISISLHNNPFTNLMKYKDNYKIYIKIVFKHLQYLNGVDFGDAKESKIFTVKNMKEKMIALEKAENNYQNIPSNKEESIKKEKVTIRTINEKMLRMNEYDLLNEKNFFDLEQTILAFLSVPSGGDDAAGDDLVDQELDDFEMFLDHFEKIIDGITGVSEQKLYSIIARFATIKNGKFTSRALSAIKQRICSDNTDQMIESFNYIYNFICSCKDSALPVNLIEDLAIFLDEPNFIVPMKRILKRVIQNVNEVSKKTLLENDTVSADKNYSSNAEKPGQYLALYRSYLIFISKAITIPEFVEDIVKLENITPFINNIKTFISESDDDIILSEDLHSVVISLLEIIKETSLKKIKEFQGILMGSGVRDRLEQRIGISLRTILNKVSEVDTTKNLLRKKRELYRKRLVIAYIHCFGGLLSISTDVSRFLSNTSVAMKIVEILSLKDFSDPLVIHGACDFTYYFLLNDQITSSEANFTLISSRLYNLRNLIPLLFPNRNEFFKVCKIADTYGEKVIERGKPVELQYMDSPMMNALFISITRLIGLFGTYANQNMAISEKCLDICSEMNDLDRDNGLANCLTLPNEDVKLHAVQCLYSIDVADLEPAELTTLYKQLKNLSSMSSKMQYVVSILFLIICRWFMTNLRKGKNDYIESCKEAIFIGMNLLAKNDLSKSAYESLNKNKTYLSAIIAVFLSNISTYDGTKKYFEDPKKREEVLSVLRAEENSVKHMNIGFPLEVEKGFSGWNIRTIIYVLQNSVVNPYTYISVRLFIHIADVLYNRPYLVYTPDYTLQPDKTMDLIVNEIRSREIKRIEDEGKNWVNIFNYDKKNTSTTKKYGYSFGGGNASYAIPGQAVKILKEDKAEQQKTFVQNFNAFLNFILGQHDKTKVSKMNQIWNMKFSTEIDNIKYSIKEAPKNISVREDLMEDYDSDDDDTDIYANNGKEYKEDFYSKLLKYLKREDYNSTQTISSNDYFSYITGELFGCHRYGKEAGIIRKENEETANNPYIRSLAISAFFKCIYVILEFPEEIATKNELIKILYSEDNIKKLCLLAECTKFQENFIATKFFIIIDIMLRNIHEYKEALNIGNDKEEEYNMNLLKKLGYISYMIRRVVKIYKKNFNLEEQDHKILLSKLCSCSSIIMAQLRNMQFESNIREISIKSMINFEVITVFITIIKEYMNREAKGAENGPVVEDKELQDMVDININILGEYMASCPSTKYDILECFTRAYTFEKYKIRKTIIREILENEAVCKRREYLSTLLSTTVFNLIAPCYVVFVDSESKVSSDDYVLVVTNEKLEFLKVKSVKSFYNAETELPQKITIPGFKDLTFKKVKDMLCFEYKNRCILTAEGGYISIFFYRMAHTDILKELLKENNHDIRVYENVAIFTENDEFHKGGALASSSPREEETVSPGEKTRGDSSEKLLEGKEDEERNKLREAIKEQVKQDKSTTMVFCNYEYQDVCNIFNRVKINPFAEKSEIEDDSKVLVVKGDTVTFYKELLDKWKNVNFDDIFRDAHAYNQNAPVIFVGNLRDFYEEVTSFSIKNYAYMNLENGTDLTFQQDPDSLRGGLTIKIYDDKSYVKLKNALKYNEIFDGYK